MMNVRKSNFEILRIISMLMIISFHYFCHGQFYFQTVNVNKLIFDTFFMFGELGVNCFILISGYFMVNSDFNFNKIIKFELKLFMYSVLLTIAAKYIFLLPVTRKDLIIACFPFSTMLYWFATCYIILVMLSPYLNKMIHNLRKDEHLRLIYICVVFWSIIATGYGFYINNTENVLMYTRLLWFIVLYIIASYIRIYDIKTKVNSWILFAFAFCLQIGVTYGLEFIGLRSGSIASRAMFLWTPNNIFMLATSVLLFLSFKNLDFKFNYYINFLAAHTFGIYLFHDNTFMRKLLWEKTLHNNMYQDSSLLIAHVVASTILVFIIGVGIDMVYNAFERTISNKIYYMDRKG